MGLTCRSVEKSELDKDFVPLDLLQVVADRICRLSAGCNDSLRTGIKDRHGCIKDLLECSCQYNHIM